MEGTSRRRSALSVGCASGAPALHLAEGTLPLAHAALWTAVAAVPLTWSLAGERHAAPPDERALTATATAVIFAASLFPIPVPVAGASSHICLTPLFALMVGVRRVVWPTACVLAAHALFFAHGGLTTLGANLLTLGVIGPVSALALFALLRACRVPAFPAVAASCAIADLCVYVGDAALLAFGLARSVAPAQTFTAVLLGFAPTQIPLAVLEGALSAYALRALAARDRVPARLRLGRSAAAAFAVVALTGCAVTGIDESVFAATAERAGQPARASLLDLSGSELGLAATIALLFGAGFVTGRFVQASQQRDDAR